MTNLLIDCSYIEKAFVASGSLVIYAARLIQGFQKYGHCRIHVLLWQEMEDTLDQFVGQKYEKIVLDRDKMFTSTKYPPATSVETRIENTEYIYRSSTHTPVWFLLLLAAL